MIIDFTHIIDNGITSYTDETKPVIKKIACINKDLYEERSINIFTHTGTHIDSPAHIINGGKYVDDYTLENLNGNAIILDFSNKFIDFKDANRIYCISGSVDRNKIITGLKSNDEYEISNCENMDDKNTLNGYNINCEDLYKYSEEISRADFILIKTGFVKYWCTDKYIKDYPSLTVDAANYLANFNIKGIGIDCISIGKHDDEITIHKVFLEKDILIIENLNLENTIKGIFKIVIAPLKMKNSDGAPARIFGFE
ncbi:MAG: cyclase family protein [Clostridium sp.]